MPVHKCGHTIAFARPRERKACVKQTGNMGRNLIPFFES